MAVFFAFPVFLYVTPVRGVAIYVYTSLIPFVLLGCLITKIKSKVFYAFLLLVVALVFSSFFLFSFSRDIKVLLFAINTFASVVMAVLLLYEEEAAVLTSKLLVFFIFSWYIYCLIFLGHTSEDANNYLYRASRNHVSFLFIISLLFYYSTLIYWNRKYSLLPALLMLPVSVQLYGRSGIFISVLIFLTILFHWLSKKKISERYMYSGIVFFALLIFVFLFFIALFNTDFVHSLPYGFERGIDSPRWEMIQGYVASIDAESFFFGSELSSISIINKYDNNPHNSFIIGHSIFGAFFLLLLLLVFLVVNYKLYFDFSIKRFVLSVLFFILCLRAFFDSLFFYGAFDYVYIYMFSILAFGSIERVNKSTRKVESSV